MPVKIRIQPKANKALYRVLQRAIEGETTTHTTASGVLRRLERLIPTTRAWSRSMGQWGSIYVLIVRSDGREVTLTEDDQSLFGRLYWELECAPYQYDRDYARRALAAFLAECLTDYAPTA